MGSYLNKGATQRRRAASRSESILRLLDPEVENSSTNRASAMYVHYRYSLDSLGDIINRVSRVHLG